MPFENIVTNLAPCTRREMLHGREHIVAPMAMLTQGVHSGSNGPLFYPEDELKRSPGSWNMKPVVVYHPSMNGVGISACDPDVLEKQAVGVILNTRYNGKLRAEAWLEIALLEKVDKRVLTAIEENRMMEVSTGLFTQNELAPGTWNGKDYEYVARTLEPDHLAILPDKIGACSIKDGAGLLQLNELADGLDGIDTSVFHALALADTSRMVANAISHSDTHGLLAHAVRAQLGENAYVIDVFDTFFVYEFGRQLYQQGYTLQKTTATLQGPPEPVTRVSQYMLADGSMVRNTQENKMTKAELVANLIANTATAWEAGDQAFLMTLEETQLAKLAPVENKGPMKGKMKGKPGDTADEGDDDDDAKAAKGKAVANAQTPPTAITLEQLPPDMQAVYNHGLATLNAERAVLLGRITANAANTYTPEQLDAKPLEELKQIAALAGDAATAAPGRAANYAGQATPLPVGNAANYVEGPLLAPTMNFGADA